MSDNGGRPTVQMGGGHEPPPDRGPIKLFVRFTPKDPNEPIPVDTLLGFMQASLNEFFWKARISGRIEITQIGGDIYIVGASGEATRG